MQIGYFAITVWKNGNTDVVCRDVDADFEQHDPRELRNHLSWMRLNGEIIQCQIHKVDYLDDAIDVTTISEVDLDTECEKHDEWDREADEEAEAQRQHIQDERARAG